MALSKSLRSQALEVLREKHLEVTAEKDRLFERAALAERDREKLGAKLHGVELALEAAMSAIAVLAGEVSSGTIAGRMAREGARQLLEQAGMKPPSSLGSSRTPKRRRKTKKTNDPGRLRHDLQVLRNLGKTPSEPEDPPAD